MKPFFAFCVFCFTLGALVGGCSFFGTPDPQRQTLDQVKAEARYTNELFACVDDASTLAESRACRAEVNKRWGIVVKEAGR